MLPIETRLNIYKWCIPRFSIWEESGFMRRCTHFCFFQRRNIRNLASQMTETGSSSTETLAGQILVLFADFDYIDWFIYFSLGIFFPAPSIHPFFCWYEKTFAYPALCRRKAKPFWMPSWQPWTLILFAAVRSRGSCDFQAVSQDFIERCLAKEMYEMNRDVMFGSLGIPSKCLFRRWRRTFFLGHRTAFVCFEHISTPNITSLRTSELSLLHHLPGHFVGTKLIPTDALLILYMGLRPGKCFIRFAWTSYPSWDFQGSKDGETGNFMCLFTFAIFFPKTGKISFRARWLSNKTFRVTICRFDVQANP